MSETIIVEAVAIAVGRADAEKTNFTKVMEDAMKVAILKAHADGLANDPDAIKARIEEARIEVKKQYGVS